MKLREQLFTVIKAHQSVSLRSAGSMSRAIFNGDWTRLPKVINGADMTTESWEKSMQWLSDNFPDEAEWPPSVPRPEPKAFEPV